MHIVSIVAFIALLAVSVYLFAKKAGEIRRNILLGRDENLNDQPNVRWRNVVLLALGQKKMFKNVPVALMHFIIYAGFIIINIEVLEIVLDGLLGKHRLFLQLLPQGLYNFLINAFEVLAALVLVVCIVFLVRRNVLKLKRFLSNDLAGWPRSDANYILVTEIVLMSLFLSMNAADQVLQAQGSEHYTATGTLWVSNLLVPAFNSFSTDTLIFVERAAWWLHIVGIFAFLNYLPYSKHLHILLAFPNAYYGRLDVQGKMQNMPAIQNEVLYAMDPAAAANAPAPEGAPQKFGAKDVFDLSWKNLLDAYSCTECGRCTSECPANLTGKKLSPRAIMMKTRDRLEEVGKNINANKGQFVDDGKSLLHDYISAEELRACTTCNACVEACPVSISPLDIILQQRRFLIMEESNAPQEWNGTFSNIENNFAPWKFSPDERDKWVSEMA
ncbi:MAG TPA: Fe-S oxidoreductase [Chitinophagaceae bacterium]|nr:Fe-S oxidoreductase [Chitinophagaceae bacterium]HAN38237.1 Fe-S oxidoreductase [Chitinophagaceae bacterium]